MPDAFNDKLKPKLLVLGNLPLLEKSPFIKDVSYHELLQGTFGASTEEADELFLALVRGRPQAPLEVTPLRFLMGQFIPPSTSGGSGPLPPPLYSFSLVLHQAAKSYKIENKHQDPPDSPRLRSISQRCEHLLQYSNLRQELPMPIPPVRGLRRASLLAHAKNEADLRILLFYLGALVTTFQGKTIQGPGKIIEGAGDTWIVVISSDFALRQLFCKCDPIEPADLGITCEKDIQIRALLERNPQQVLDALSYTLWIKPLRDIYEMSEATFQQMWDDFFEFGQRNSAYINSYFPQLGLLTDESQKEDPLLDYKAGMGRFGYMDLLLCYWLHLHPNRVAAVELKTISLEDLYRAECRSEKETKKLVYHFKGGTNTFSDQCNKKIDEINKMTLDELRKVTYHFYSFNKTTNKSESNRVTIGDMLVDAEKQLEAYMNALVNGEAWVRDGGSKMEGITVKADKRVEVIRGAKVDEVFGIVAFCVGTRIIALIQEPKKQNKLHTYKGVKGWHDIIRKR
ncbi:hypothetical protein C8R46DRAFT_342382 [Mycena filopes]|nr:hypothetical protein C8R46DRAFT_342382 [Mycena filopes]